MKNVNILLALSLFSFLRTSYDSGMISQPFSTANADIRKSVDLGREFLGCDLSCMSGKVMESVPDQANDVLALLQMVCSRIGCAAAPEATDISPSIPAHQESMPALFNKDAHRFEAPDILHGSIIES